MRPVVATVSCALIFALSAPAAKAAGEVSLIVWPATLQLSDNAGNAASWNTTFTGIVLRLDHAPRFGFRMSSVIGSEQLPAGTPAGTGGTDSVWSADITYRWESATFTGHGFLGYGAFNQLTTNPGFGFRQFASAGYRVGADISAQLTGNWTFNAEVFWQPSNTVTLQTSSGTTSSSAPATGWQLSLVTILKEWRIEAGWRALSVGTGAPSSAPCPCNAQGSGWFLGFGKNF